MNNKPKTLHILGSTTRYWSFNNDQSKTLVMIHGFRGTHHGLQKIIDRLPEYRVIIPDLPGFGASTPMTGAKHDIAGYTAFTVALINELGLRRPVVVGHSFGSIIAAAVAAEHPQLVDKLILINPIASPTAKDPRWPLTKASQFYYWLSSVLPAKTGRALLSNRFIVLAVSAAMAKTKNAVLRKDIHQKHLAQFSTFQDPKLLHEIFLTSSNTSVKQFASDIKAKTLLIAGALDNIAPLATQNALHRMLPGSELVVIPRVGHLIHHEASVRCSQAIRAFLRGQQV